MAIDPAILDAFKNQLANFQANLKTTYAQYVRNKADFDTAIFKANALFSGVKAQFDNLNNLRYTTYTNANSDEAKIIGAVSTNFQYPINSFHFLNEAASRNYFLSVMVQNYTNLIGFDYAKFLGWFKASYPNVPDSSPAWPIVKQFFDTQVPIFVEVAKTLQTIKVYSDQIASSEKALADLKSAIDGYLSQFAQYKNDIANFPSYDDLLSAAKDDHPLAILAPPVVSVPVEQAPPPQPPQQIVQPPPVVKKGIDPKFLAAGAAALFLLMRKK